MEGGYKIDICWTSEYLATSSHRSQASPYSRLSIRRDCVFGKQSLGPFTAALELHRKGFTLPGALLRSYGAICEFLNEVLRSPGYSLPATCVGFGTGTRPPRRFSRRHGFRTSRLRARSRLRLNAGGFTYRNPTRLPRRPSPGIP